MSSIDLQLYVCCGGPLLCPAFFEVKIFQNPFLLSFSFPLVFLSYFLISILLGFSKCLISQNIGGLMFVVGVLYCVQLYFLGRFNDILWCF